MQIYLYAYPGINDDIRLIEEDAQASACRLYVARQGILCFRNYLFRWNNLSFSLNMQLVKTFIFLHSDYAALINMDVNLTWGLKLQTAHNPCIRFDIGNISLFMLTREFTSHVTYWWVKLGWLSLAYKSHLQLIALPHDKQREKGSGKLFRKIK